MRDTHPLPEATIRELIARTRDPDATEPERIEARNRIIISNTRWRRHLACRIATQHGLATLTVDDLESAGVFGEMRAIQKFDPVRTVRYITYATYWIFNTMVKAIEEEEDAIRRPKDISRLDGQVRRLANRLDISEREAIQRIPGLHPNAYKRLQQSRRRIGSINARERTRENGNPRDPVAREPVAREPDPIDNAINREEIARLRAAIGGLPEKYQRILRRRMNGETLIVIGADLGISRERVRQIEMVSRKMIRKHMKETTCSS